MMVVEPICISVDIVAEADTSSRDCVPKGVRFASGRQADKDTSSDSDDGVCKASSRTSIRHGVASDQGRRRNMEDAHAVAHQIADGLCMDGLPDIVPRSALFAVFDGHCGSHAAEFASERILHRVTHSHHFPTDIKTSLEQAFIKIDSDYWAAINSCSTSAAEAAGTTALAAVVWGTTLYVANAGDSRAVLSRSGKAIELTRDHKPAEPQERLRIEQQGGFVCTEGLLCGELAVARAIGDYHLPNLKGEAGAAGPIGPLTAEPEVTQHELTGNDEFIIIGCDGLWDVLSSQRAVELARAGLRAHNDPQRCADQLVAEALEKHSSDNITVIVVCFGDDPPKKRIYGNGRFSRNVSQVGLSTLAAALGEQKLQ